MTLISPTCNQYNYVLYGYSNDCYLSSHPQLEVGDNKPYAATFMTIIFKSRWYD